MGEREEDDRDGREKRWKERQEWERERDRVCDRKIRRETGVRER